MSGVGFTDPTQTQNLTLERRGFNRPYAGRKGASAAGGQGAF
ncbi:hypothetical protein SAMN04487859_11085 [Roseovarius lutimaris]|uniref:Uncharacterized protein n=1 Tax=Roseovarius lutimaris TaxID=1005928 RepID=A0A1I5CK20_9RHOB|nr:hypothetical protein SAMN04487859_11085 [Roseovarius lutimaris]